jgi:cytochrome c556
MSFTSIKNLIIKPAAITLKSLALVAAVSSISGSAFANPDMRGQPMDKATMMEMQKVMKSDMSKMKPDLQKQVKQLSKPTKKALMNILSGHSRRSQTLSLRQVMHEVLADYQSIISGIATENNAQAADAARRLANHRLPVGGLIPYLKKQDVNDGKLATLVGFNDLVEGNALRLADAADKGNTSKAATYIGKIAEGCVACHQVFRGQPGVSNRLR